MLDENIGLIRARILTEEGYDAVSIIEEMAGSDDADVIKRAYRKRRVPVTFDRDFGFLVYKHHTPHAGVLYLRLNNESPPYVARVLGLVIKHYGVKLQAGKFVTVPDSTVRVR